METAEVPISLSSQTSNFILTILIPTFNGEKTIARALSSVISQIESNHLENIVRVIVADNCSTDSTREIVKKISESRNWVRLLNGEKNLGLDKNLSSALSTVLTPFVKVLGDDDLVLDKFIPHLLSLIEKNSEVDLIVSSMQAIGDSDTTQQEFSEQQVWNFAGDATFITRTNGCFGQLSTLCFRTESWFDTDNSVILEDYYHHNMEFVGRVYHLAIYGSCIYDDSRLMENDLGPKRWFGTYLDLFKVNCSHASFIFAIDSLDLSGFPNPESWFSWIKRSKKSLVHQLILDIINLRKNKIASNDDSILAFIPSEIRGNHFFLIFVRIVNFLPSSLCTLIVRVEFRLRKLKSRLSV